MEYQFLETSTEKEGRPRGICLRDEVIVIIRGMRQDFFCFRMLIK